MTKIAKNLKRLRVEQKMTQEALAEKINISRQAISNWENDKTQPDIESLEALSEVFGVPVEELIYGKKRQVGTVFDGERAKTKIRIILAVIGSLFLGLGVVLIFVNFWQELPRFIKIILSLAPILCGQAFAVYVTKEYEEEDILWRESASVIWLIGSVATVSLVNGIFGIHFPFKAYLFIDLLLCLPIFFLMDSVSPVIFYYYMVINWSLLSGRFIIGLILLTAGFLFVYLHRKASEDGRYKYLLWISAFALVFFSFTICIDLAVPPAGLPLAVFIAFYAMSETNRGFAKPWRAVGALGILCVLSAYSALLIEDLIFKDLIYNSFGDLGTGIFGDRRIPLIISSAVSAVIIAVGIFLGRRSFKKNLYKILIIADSVFGMASILLLTVTYIKLFAVFAILSVTALGLLCILKGVKELRLAPVNFGLLTIFFQIFALNSIFTQKTIYLGLAFIIFGAVLILINVRLSKEIKAKNEEEQTL